MKRFSAIFLFSVLATILFVLAANAKTSYAMDVDGQLLARARFALSCLEAKDWDRLAGVIHPHDGIVFSPYAYVEEDAVKLNAEEVSQLGAGEKIYVWGTYDGSGEPVELSFIDYYRRFVYDKDFMNALEVAANSLIRTGNTESNLGEVFEADDEFVEFHCPGEGPHADFEWASLRIVFRNYRGTWYVVGVVHDGWTI